MLTARDTELDKLLGLELGADDYLTKPFSPRELVARVRAMLRRPRTGTVAREPADDQRLTSGGLVVDPVSRKAWRAGDESELDLTRTEFDLLAALAASPRRAFTRRQLIDEVWGSDWFGDERIVDVHIGHLRRKLGDDAAQPRHIRTVRGVGYGMAAP
jgi:DNA-binding response OmpR family regulator